MDTKSWPESVPSKVNPATACGPFIDTLPSHPDTVPTSTFYMTKGWHMAILTYWLTCKFTCDALEQLLANRMVSSALLDNYFQGSVKTLICMSPLTRLSR